MSTMFFRTPALAAVYLVSRCDPKDLATISAANAAAYREHYRVNDACAPTVVEIVDSAAELPCNPATLEEAITIAALLSGNCEHETDFRDSSVLKAFAQVLPAMMLIAKDLHEHGAEWVLHAVREHQRELRLAREDRKARPTPCLLSDEVVKLTGDIRTMGTRWTGFSSLRVGETVTDEIYWDMLEVLPPACNTSNLLQLGEPADYNGPGNRPRFMTLQRFQGQWVYTGLQTQGMRVRIER